jgi:hypothetical protein
MSKEELNPMQVWRDWFIKSEKAWSQSLTEMMGDEQFSKGMGRYMQEAMHTHRMMTESIGQYLASLNIPSRADIVDLSDRLGQIEDTLAAIQVDLREQRAQLAQAMRAAKTGEVKSGDTDAAPTKVARTRRAPEA